MSYEFAVGQKVVCVDDTKHPGFVYEDTWSLKRGSIYTIRWIGPMRSGGLGIRIAEIVRDNSGLRPAVHEDDSAFAASRFRPLESNSIELFRAIAADPSKFNFTPSKRERERVRT